jgi:hypothetical protein
MGTQCGFEPPQRLRLKAGKYNMPMRDELAIPATALDDGAGGGGDIWSIIGFCLIGSAIALYFSICSTPLDQMSLLIMQSNLF